MRITLITEGTYPQHLGGVSVWCDQLVRELDEHTFDVLALSARPSEQSIWELPPNVASLKTVPLWGRLPAPLPRKKLLSRFSPALDRFLQSLVPGEEDKFVSSLCELAEFVRSGELGPALRSDDAVRALMAAGPRLTDGHRHAGTPLLSVADAVDVLVLLEHFLRPLTAQVRGTDLSHTTANGLGALPALMAKWESGTPMLITEHGVYLRELYLSYPPGHLAQPARAVVLRFFKLLIETAYQHADIVAPVCLYNGLWELVNGTPAERVHPVHNGVDPSLFPPAPAEPSRPTLVWVGRIDPLKDIETLLRAFSQVRETVPDCRLRLFGPVPAGGEAYFRRCTQLSAELGLDHGAATFEGRVSPPLKAYHAGHVLVLTSISEGLPYVVLEAMATGLPVIATAVGGVAEAIGDAGLLVPPKQPQPLAEACTELLRDPARRRAMGEAARERVLQHFTSKRAFGAYRELYQQLRRGGPQVIELREAPAGTATAEVAMDNVSSPAVPGPRQ